MRLGSLGVFSLSGGCSSCSRLLLLAGRNRERGQWGWGVMSGLAIDRACVLAGGKRVIVCVGSWQACKMPGMRMYWRRLLWR
jgi:hypothetical protein